MIKIVKRVLNIITPKRLILFYQQQINEEYKRLLQYGTISYSQEGEDIILQRIFGNKNSGFYVDVGAHHPKRFSNTYLFYQKGWRGINIDPMPGVMKHFDELRPRDINLEVAISDRNEKQTYYIFNEPALNTFSKEEAQRKDGLGDYKIVESFEIKTVRLDEILDNYLPDNLSIDFMSIDVEGFDLNVLRSNDWEKFRPNIVLAEALDNNLISILDSRITKYMKSKDYELFAKTYNTIFFIKK